jgi:D-3-phosphoglycerate dehydrogenase
MEFNLRFALHSSYNGSECTILSTPEGASVLLKLALIADRFFRPQIVAELLERHLRPVVEEYALAVTEVGWPDDTPIHDDELQEYVGDPAAVAAFAVDAHAVLTQVAPISRRLIEQAGNLQAIACGRGGPVNVNVAAATEHGIPVLHAPGANAQAVAEFTLALMLAALKRIPQAHSALAAGDWNADLYHYELSPRELRDQTIGLIGFGHIGQLLAPLLQPLGPRIVVSDPYLPAQRSAALGVTPVDLDTLLAESDIVSIHARVTPETRQMMGARQFAAMKRGAYFINTARGPLVDYDALYAALASGHLGGAALDCFGIEPPPPDWPLLKLPNVTLTPHVAGSSRETAWRKAEYVIRDLANFYAGRPLVHCANPAWKDEKRLLTDDTDEHG